MGGIFTWPQPPLCNVGASHRTGLTSILGRVQNETLPANAIRMPGAAGEGEKRKKKKIKKWLLIIVAVFALKILCGGPGKGGNPNEEYSAGFLCAVTTQEPQLVSQEVVESHELTPVIPLGGQMLLPGWGGDNEDQEHSERCSESFQVYPAEAGGGCRSCPCSGFYPLPNLPTHPAKCGNAGKGGSSAVKGIKWNSSISFPRKGNSAATTKKIPGLWGLD